MGILDRFTEIVKANVNDLLDKAEDPAKMIDQYMREMTDDLAEIKEETAAVMAEETRCRRACDENDKEIDHYDDLARQAVKAGNDEDARVFLAKKQDLVTKGEGLSQAYEVAHDNATKMREMHDKLVSDIDTLNARRASIKAKTSVAKTQQKVNEIATGSNSKKSENAMSAFARMEAKADQMLDQANATAELNSQPIDTVADLENRYSSTGKTAFVDAELAALKAELGMDDDVDEVVIEEDEDI